MSWRADGRHEKYETEKEKDAQVIWGSPNLQWPLHFKSLPLHLCGQCRKKIHVCVDGVQLILHSPEFWALFCVPYTEMLRIFRFNNTVKPVKHLETKFSPKTLSIDSIKYFSHPITFIWLKSGHRNKGIWEDSGNEIHEKHNRVQFIRPQKKLRYLIRLSRKNSTV